MEKTKDFTLTTEQTCAFHLRLDIAEDLLNILHTPRFLRPPERLLQLTILARVRSILSVLRQRVLRQLDGVDEATDQAAVLGDLAPRLLAVGGERAQRVETGRGEAPVHRLVEHACESVNACEHFRRRCMCAGFELLYECYQRKSCKYLKRATRRINEIFI